MPADDEQPIIPPDDFPQQENESALPGEYAGVFDVVGNHVVRTFMVPWENYFDYVQQILGYATFDGTTMQRYLPYRDFDNRQMIATRVEVRGICYRGSDFLVGSPLTSSNRYRWAKLIVTFATVPFQLGELADPTGNPDTTGQLGAPAPPPIGETIRFAFKEVRAAKEYITLKPGGYCFEALDMSGNPIDGPVIQRDVAQLLSYDDVIVTVYSWPRDAFPDSAIQACEGKVNVGDTWLPAFPPPSLYEAETLYLQSHSTQLTYFPSGLEACNITYYFKRRSVPILDSAGNLTDNVAGFNHAPNQDNVFLRVRRVGQSGKGIYDTADFSKLFSPGGL